VKTLQTVRVFEVVQAVAVAGLEWAVRVELVVGVFAVAGVEAVVAMVPGVEMPVMQLALELAVKLRAVRRLVGQRAVVKMSSGVVWPEASTPFQHRHSPSCQKARNALEHRGMRVEKLVQELSLLVGMCQVRSSLL
jgi:hypothetical protein